MITFNNSEFRLTTKHSSYIFQITKFLHLEHLYYGSRIPDDQDASVFQLKRNAVVGSSVIYDISDEMYCLNNMCLEWSGIGKGDYRHSPSELKMPDDSYTNDFKYQDYEIVEGASHSETLPTSYGDLSDAQTLIIHLLDESNQVKINMFYTVYPNCDVITRRVRLTNNNLKKLTIRKLLSMSLDIPNADYRTIRFHGGWIKEGHREEHKLPHGITINSSTTGDSSNKHNPGFLLAAASANESKGDVYGFNLVYSGNHFSLLELSTQDILRIQMGINPHCFEWDLNNEETFETPEVIMTFSSKGVNGVSQQFHDFINNHIVRSDWKSKERPVLLNNWEAHFFKFNERKLLKLAKQSQKLGVELFVLDDGWFKNRNSDTAGLGDYEVNKAKIRSGMKGFSEKIHKMGLMFGLWFEPEMINEDSDLYRSHPEYALKTPGKVPALGRNQLVLDLCNPKVRDYIVKQVTTLLDECQIDYVKWDYNRHISDAYSNSLNQQGKFFHSYILGLYDVLNRIFSSRPHILFESCSSGGNRFDLGMLCYSPQIWTSDNTDPIERLKIQGGLSCLYPLSTMGAHVSQAPHQQTLRQTPLSTRFNVASFGCLGYELDLKYLSKVQKQEVKEQILFYKKYRKTLQYGQFTREISSKDNKVIWHCVSKDKKEAITGLFQTQAKASETFDRLKVPHLNKNKKYTVKTKEQSLYIDRFGGLIKHVVPISLNPNGWIIRTVSKYYALQDCVENYEAYGEVLNKGIQLNTQFIGTYYNEHTRLLGDFGSSLYMIHQSGEKI